MDRVKHVFGGHNTALEAYEAMTRANGCLHETIGALQYQLAQATIDLANRQAIIVHRDATVDTLSAKIVALEERLAL